jgi:CspA family cold shock protein
MPIGIVKFWRDGSGWGFVSPDQPSAGDVFAHISAVTGGFSSLTAGQRVEYQLGMGRNGRECAVRVEVLEPVISPRATPRAFRPDAGDAGDEHTAHMELTQTTFMRR